MQLISQNRSAKNIIETKHIRNSDPGKTACEIASPIKDIPRKIMNEPITPEMSPTIIDVKRAFCKIDNGINHQ